MYYLCRALVASLLLVTCAAANPKTVSVLEIEAGEKLSLICPADKILPGWEYRGTEKEFLLHVKEENGVVLLRITSSYSHCQYEYRLDSNVLGETPNVLFGGYSNTTAPTNYIFLKGQEYIIEVSKENTITLVEGLVKSCEVSINENPHDPKPIDKFLFPAEPVTGFKLEACPMLVNSLIYRRAVELMIRSENLERNVTFFLNEVIIDGRKVIKW